MAVIIVTVDPEGNVQVEAGKVTGPGCAALTAAIERAIGTTTKDVKKPEYVQQQTNAARSIQQ